MKKIMILANDTTYTYNLRDILIKRLISDGFKVVICCERLNYEKEIIELGAKIIDIKMHRRSTNPILDVFLLFRFITVILEEKPNVVLTYNIKPNVYGGMACKILHVPYIPNITGLGTAVENASFIQKISLTLYKKGVSNAACVMFQNEGNREYFIKSSLMGKNSHSRLLPGSGVNLEKFNLESYPDKDSPVVFSIIGRIMKDKGTDELLEAIKVVKQKYPDVHFRMIGYFDDNYQAIIKTAVDKGLIEYYEEQKDIRPFLKESWAVIQPSHHEGMSNVLLESAATGRPVIATDIPGCRESFDNEISGFSFKVGNYQALAETIMRFIEMQYDKKVNMGKSGREKMLREFDRNIVANAYLDEIDGVGGKKDATV